MCLYSVIHEDKLRYKGCNIGKLYVPALSRITNEVMLLHFVTKTMLSLCFKVFFEKKNDNSN